MQKTNTILMCIDLVLTRIKAIKKKCSVKKLQSDMTCSIQ